MEFRKLIPLGLLASLLSACVDPNAASQSYVEGVPADQPMAHATRVTPSPSVRQINAPEPIALAPNAPNTTRIRQIDPAKLTTPKPAATPPDPKTVIAQAMNAATMTASQANFDNATQIYDYWPGIQYQVLTTPNRITNIALRPGEELTKNPLSLGESANWVVAKNQIGAGKAIQWNIIIKPKLSARDTNAIIYTRDRTYILELIVVPPDNIDPVPAKNAPKTTPIYNNVIAWNYPDAETDALSQLGETTEQKAVDHSSTINPADLDFGYRIDVKGPRPSWLPTAVYTDQKRTWITFPYDMATATDTPILFLLNNANDPTPKTYTPQKDRYIVPGIIRSAQLRTDKESATIVTITRTGN